MIAIAGGILLALLILFALVCLEDRDSRGVGFFILFVVLVCATAAGAQDATVYVVPKPVNEQVKIEALKLGYILNGNSMVGWGSIDLTDPAVLGEPTRVRPRVIKPEPRK